ncbi:hypothetical protein GCM10008014_24880 [Paenibacillus silvae]|uniref:Uncharacterized protein n=1 Tax=Paenibacillus silvae TaxID=1325358 RepID=A0ABQ1ZD31_9BACL|nr:hypothetical protein [Paenibacillus silvae]GGH55348.1 hypothetical protein GCM10008014_24880 [Paenibacillus silvae]
MTNDDFDYYNDQDFEWTGVLKLYSGSEFSNQKGTIFRIELLLAEDLEESELSILKSLGQSWTWGEDRRIKAFELLDFQCINKKLVFDFRTIRKSQRYDEIKYFLFDLDAGIESGGNKIEEIQLRELK